MKYSYYFLGSICFLTSCTKEVEIDLPVHEPKLVVYSTIVPLTFPYPKPLSVSLQLTSMLSDTATYPVCDAKILYFENNILIDTLTCTDSTGTYAISKSMQAYPVEENSYTIKVLREGFEPVTASTTIPSKVTIQDIVLTPVAFFDEDGQVQSEVSITFNDPADEYNYYELAISSGAFFYDDPMYYKNLITNDNIITSENYYPSLIRFDLQPPQFLLFSDKKINGKEYTMNVYYQPFQSLDSINTHDITVHLRNVTEDYYKFKTTLLQHTYGNREDYLYGIEEPLNVFTNIHNGYGLFAGFNNDMVSFRIEKQKIWNRK